MESNNKMLYDVDLVFCIDTTGSMRHVIEIVKKNALNLYGDIIRALSAKGKTLSAMRVRVVAFRDYQYDKDKAMRASQFLTLPAEADTLKEAVDLLDADGGGDYPESGLEALAYAIRSEWRTESVKKRHVIVLWTDAAAHPLGTGGDSEFYAPVLPKTFRELSEWWGDPQNPGHMNRFAKIGRASCRERV